MITLSNFHPFSLKFSTKSKTFVYVPHRCEPFSTYPRTYDLLHVDHLLSHFKIHGKGCLLEDIMLEMDRIIRPQVFYRALTLKPSYRSHYHWIIHLILLCLWLEVMFNADCGVCRDSSLSETRNRSSQESETWLLSSFGKLKHMSFKTNTRRQKLFYFAERNFGQSFETSICVDA